jgi:3-hydroxy acid dehydrogenase / malonic semialdehyde reductase
MKDKIVFITGASSGIGEACARIFARHGAKLILAARRDKRLKTLSEDLKKKYGTESKVVKLDVRNRPAVSKKLSKFAVDILINNAGLSRGLDKLHEGKFQDWDEMLDTNVKGLLYVSRAVIPNMVKRNSGHVINIGSVAGHEVYPKGSVYCASKHAVDSITKGMRMDLADTNVKVTTIDPGLVETEFSIVRFRGNKKKAKTVYQGIEPLTPDDVADAVYYSATRRENFVIAEMLLLPRHQASAMVIERFKN